MEPFPVSDLNVPESMPAKGYDKLDAKSISNGLANGISNGEGDLFK